MYLPTYQQNSMSTAVSNYFIIILKRKTPGKWRSPKFKPNARWKVAQLFQNYKR